MNLAFRLLLSPTSTSVINQHTIHPHAHWFSHQRTNDSLFRPVTFPDSIPRLSPTFRLDQGDFFDIKPPPSSRGYSYIITLFFIDTSLNIIRTIQQLFSLLEPGGVWINLGPLLWTQSGAALELSLDEVLQVALEIGSELLPLGQFTRDPDTADLNKISRSIGCEYTSDQKAMMRWIYQAELWVARKPLY
jgi:N2227-like protein